MGPVVGSIPRDTQHGGRARRGQGTAPGAVSMLLHFVFGGVGAWGVWG